MKPNALVAALRPALVLIALFTLLTGIVLPLGFVAGAGAVVPHAAAGSLLRRDGRVIGSALIGQAFTKPWYFHGRPSATMGEDPAHPGQMVAMPYDAMASGGSNLGPTSTALLARVRGDVAALGGGSVPGDAVTSSASGLDPDISPQNAALQVARVARARGLPPGRVAVLVAEQTRGRLLGLIGEPRVNVLQLNLALDAASAP